MAENKGGSDLDVFEGLAKKKPASGGAVPGAPTLPGAIPSQRGPVLPPPSRQKTLLGITPNLPPPTPSQRSSALPPPAPPSRPSAVPGRPPSAPPAPPSRSSLPAPPPPQARLSATPPLPPAPLAPSATPLPIPEAPAPQPSAAPSIPLATPSAIAAAPVDMDWDDDDEKTTIFDKGDALSSLAPLPAAGAPAPSRTLISPVSSPAPASRAPSPASMPPPAPRSVPPQAPALSTPAPVQRSVAPASVAAPSIAAPPSMAMHTPQAGSKTGLIIGLAVAGAALLGIGVFALAQPKEGKLAVFVAASGGRSLDDVSVLVNGTKQCDTAPCRIELPKGVHEIKAMAPGYAPITQGVTVIAGEEQAVNLSLSPASLGTGLRVAGASGVTLSIGGQEIGPLPQELKDLAPGQHTLLFKGGDMYAPEEKVVTIVADQIQDLGTVQLKLVRGLASFDLRTPGATLTLVSGTERRTISDPSKPVEVDASKSWRVEATKAGFDDFSAPLSFDDKAEKTFVVELAEKAKPAAPTPVAAQAPRPAPTQRPAPAAPAGGNCTLNINSIPVSNVVLNGRPLGGTPKLGVSVKAGSHTVVFVHPEFGKKSTTTSCKAGETKTVAMRLNK